MRLLFVCISLIFGLSIFTLAQSPQEALPPGMVMVPGGTFLMGSKANENTSAFPAHLVTLFPFYMDKCEVSNSEYYEFCMNAGHKLPEFWGMEIYKSGSGS